MHRQLVTEQALTNFSKKLINFSFEIYKYLLCKFALKMGTFNGESVRTILQRTFGES